MRSVFLSLVSILLVSGVLPAHAAQEATVQARRANVRALPSSTSEALVQLKQGESVTVIEEVDDPTARGDEPRRWAKIEMPASVSVWIAASLVDRNTVTVTGDGVNLRAGPGRNFSSVGRLAKGTTVTEIRYEDGWLQIEPPPGAFAYVAASLLTPAATAAPVALVPPATTPPARNEPQKWITAQDTAPRPEPPPAATPANLPPSTQAAEALPPAEPLAPSPVAATPPPRPAPKIPGRFISTKRVVTRTGVVEHTLSLTSPTAWELRSRKGEGLMNYLWDPEGKINFMHYNWRGVTVTGEEYIDAKRPRVPLLRIESIEER